MSEEQGKSDAEGGIGAGPAPDGSDDDAVPREAPREKSGGVSDFLRRAVAAGFDVANRSKDDLVRVAAAEMRNWLDHMELDQELVKVLSKMTMEVKAEFRFRPTEDGRITAENTSTESKVRVRPPGEDDE